MQYQELTLQNYVYHFIKKMNIRYYFRDKRILFLYMDPALDNAKLFLKFNAESVYYANPDFTFEKSDELNITKLNFGELSKIPDNSIDLVIGLEVLEHINDFKEFISQITRIATPVANIELQGFPMWTSPIGHHIWLPPKYRFNDKTNPFDYWEHLMYKNKDEMYDALLAKGYDKTDSKEISDWIFNEKQVNRISPEEIIKEFVKNSYETEYRREFADKMPVLIKKFIENNKEYIITHYMTDIPKNQFFEAAKQNYSETELLTNYFTIRISNNKTVSNETDVDIDDFMKDYVDEFRRRYGFRHKRVLNITPFSSYETSKLIAAYGADHVTAVSPLYCGNEINAEGETISCIGLDYDNIQNLNDKYDVVFGANIVPYMKNFKEFIIKAVNLLNPDGLIFLQGAYLWPSAYGHNFPTHLNIQYIRADSHLSPLLPWEHLIYDDRDKLNEILLKRGYSEEDTETILTYMFDESVLNKYSYLDFINILKEIPNITFGCTKILDYTKENEFYTAASQRYTSEELKTANVYLVVRHKREYD